MTRREHPPGYDPDQPGSDVFDPALRNYGHAFRRGDPALIDESLRAKWSRAREEALLELTERVMHSDIGDALVLRGGLTMRAWFGERARDPKDADFVVIPPSVGPDDPKGREILDGVVEAVSAPLESSLLVLRENAVTWTGIWTYERAEGRRVVVPFEGRDPRLHLPAGSLQLDLVFRETMRDPPEDLVLVDPIVHVMGASMRESLAWKLMWLASDKFPQGKDLYDAVLLAEELAPADRKAALRAFIDEVSLFHPELGSHRRWDDELRNAFESVEDQWKEFEADYPQLAHLSVQELTTRLTSALGL